MSKTRDLLAALVIRLTFVVALFAAVLMPAAAQSTDAELKLLVDALAARGFSETEDAIKALAFTGDDRVAAVLGALGEGNLFVGKTSKQVVIGRAAGRDLVLTDPVTRAEIGTEPSAAYTKIRVNNRLRRTIQAAIGTLTLLSDNPVTRRAAAEAVMKTRDPETIPALDAAIAEETDAGILQVMQEARAAAVLNSDAAEADKVAAIATIAGRGDRESLSILTQYIAAPGEVGVAAQAAVDDVNTTIALWNAGQNIWFGVSLGSVLLLAAIGLAITFGVMGVINMAHGEMVMIGAYTTFVVQQQIRMYAPGLFDFSLLIALPLAFLVAGAIGVAIERGVIRFLYGRPLETLLATWGISLILQQAVRSRFGAQNQQVGNPSWMSGSFDVGLISITYSRLWIVVFAIFVFFALMALLKRTPFGLQTRAVTANRQMASAMGIRTPWIDAMTFGLGSGVAGIAGVALSQIENVSPNLGQGYIIDSFMVVVFGGVGNLWGTLVGALTLGIANKFLEPYAGAVLGKIFVLVFIILFIQKRPRGLFALKGRSIEA
ncbi:urea ABC transporter permease subunit UrtB [Methylobrevis albus]|uniref:Urea ABC transporter permease subunit UrtB n=1 Tax=Methylobrevis albus TaxID=2793297 RepID=A0A931I1K8_9HYPH|nr:urea ABC transporter permease subunit UrtB [Methylobrevis albus]MBH0238607.1 urea ABC transporter permease subunit UrtB [Methylobrevis albus]